MNINPAAESYDASTTRQFGSRQSSLLLCVCDGQYPATASTGTTFQQNDLGADLSTGQQAHIHFDACLSALKLAA